ncbi:MAG: hypothetical protein R3B46_14350 [Phycisphaerales bacterium]
MRSPHVAFADLVRGSSSAAHPPATPTADASGGSTMAPVERGFGQCLPRPTTDFRPINDDKAVMTVHGMGCPLCAENTSKTLAGITG